ncbi:cystatin-A-like [Ruditapes philippinarum]|uniref:cystatin-A-like n=1 Tax=Ruditapes philippinarum TaxID=129788 RepID=UPI00295BA330|nr:cystatin-A-like [Ruditapes philippinarum]
MLPKSKILDAEACLSCSCSKKSLKCKDITKLPGCKLMPGGQMTQNPFDKEWKVMVDKLIQSKYIGKYQILQVRTQVVAGTNTYLKLLATDRLCDLKIYTNFKGLSEISDDPCSIGKVY